MLPVRKDISPKEVRNFGWMTLGGFLVLGGLLWLAGGRPGARCGWCGSPRQDLAIVLWVLGAAFALICTISHATGLRLYVGWMTAAGWLGNIMTMVVLSVVFVVVLPVFSLIRLKDPLRIKLKEGGSYWENAEPYEPTLDRMMRPF